MNHLIGETEIKDCDETLISCLTANGSMSSAFNCSKIHFETKLRTGKRLREGNP